MKVIIAYDGSTYADAAIDDLARSGLPRDSELMVVWVADLSTNRPAVSEFDLISAASGRVDGVLARAKGFEAQVVKETRSMTSKVVDRLSREFPEWKVRPEVLRGKPADELLRKVDAWNADLIMGGSQGRSAIGRFFLGSVSKSVAENAASSVRIVRRGYDKTDSEPIKIILGAKNPEETEVIVKAVSRRVWPANTRMRLVAVDDGVSAGRVSAVYPYAKLIYESAAENLAAVGLDVSVEIESGDPKAIFLEAADAWSADAIFVAAGNTKDQGGLDETTSALVTKAKCTVEIVR